jgi:hypothetical protein
MSIERRRPRVFERRGAVTELGDIEPGQRQVEAHQFTNGGFVLDDEYPAFALGHRCSMYNTRQCPASSR